MIHSEKKISVITGVYNCEDTLPDAVRSIQDQTYRNWELILCDDGSTDRTLKIAEECAEKDPRIKVIRNEKNLGLNKTLNHCLLYADGDYIARMDGDDICDPQRFEKQIRVLESQDQYKICSSAMFFFDENGIWGKNTVIEYPAKEDVVTKTAICHAPVMMARECMDAANGYSEDPKTLRVEDVDLWIRLYALGYLCHNLPEPLYGMRNDQNAFQRRKYVYRVNSARVRLRGCKTLNLPWVYYVKALKPLAVGLVPARLRAKIRHFISNRRGKKL